MKPYQLPGKVLLRLKALFAQRERLIEMRKGLQIAQKSMAGYADELIADIEQQNLKLLQELKSRIKEVDAALQDCLREDQEISQKAQQMQSVLGIGLQIAVYMLIVSRGMQAFDSPRKFACYSGCAPFAYQSGASLHGKSRVHFMANKKMKCLLHMAALNAITFDEELKQYYQRKVKNGKSPMSVLNAVRFKLICRIFSVVKREFYRCDYQKIAA